MRETSESRKRKIHNHELKEKVGLEALKRVKTINAIGQEYVVHPVQVGHSGGMLCALQRRAFASTPWYSTQD